MSLKMIHAAVLPHTKEGKSHPAINVMNSTHFCQTYLYSHYNPWQTDSGIPLRIYIA